MDLTHLAAASLALLATPGPTNTLLATSGAANGIRRSLPLLAAEVSGYLVTIVVLRVLIGPAVAATPALGDGLRVAAALYLAVLAARLWQVGVSDAREPRCFGFRCVFVTTLLNPKAIIFAFTILPASVGIAAVIPALAVISCLMLLAGCAWIVAGASLRQGLGPHVPAAVGYRASALALIGLAASLSLPVLQAAARV